jgi:hypothetical protein
MKTKISATIVAHSKNVQGDELISVLLVMPRIVLAEFNKHRMLSSNTSSSRAVPFAKMVEVVENDPFIPIAWQKQHSGMQGTEYFTAQKDIDRLNEHHLISRDMAVMCAKNQNNLGATKQICNRYLEPFMWCTVLATGNKESWNSFFNLRCPAYRVGGKGDIASSTNTYKSKKDAIKDYPNSADEPNINWMYWNEGQAEIHMMALAECIWDAYNESTPKQLKAGEYHLPMIEVIED